MKNPLDPLLLKLSKDYMNDAGLSLILQDLFKVCANPLNPQHARNSLSNVTAREKGGSEREGGQVLDSDGSGGLTSHEFQAAMKKLVPDARCGMSDPLDT